MSPMREFWLEPSPHLPEEDVRKLAETVSPDTVLLTHNILSVNAKIASRQKGADILVTRDEDEAETAKRAGGTVALEYQVNDRGDHQKVIRSLKVHPDYLLVSCPDWKVIPLENLIAEVRGKSKLLARTSSYEESRTALATLELGVDGIVLSTQNLQEMVKTRELLTENQTTLFLRKAKVTFVKPIGTGSRVCVDTCEIIRPNEGLLTGCSSQGLFLVEAEVHSSLHVNPRPFRVNAGPVSLYVLAPGGKTRYLSELSAGENVLLVDVTGRTRAVDVARVKIERRPMILVEAEIEGRTVKTILQNAETVRLITPEGSKPVSELKPGDQVFARLEEGGRHFGTRVPEEMIVER